jgi:arginyl-tRNA synthetase
VLRKAESLKINQPESFSIEALEPSERNVIALLSSYPERLQEAARTYSPAVMANYAYELAKEFNQFYQSITILSEPDQEKLKFRVQLAAVTGNAIKQSMKLLGIQVPERM